MQRQTLSGFDTVIGVVAVIALLACGVLGAYMGWSQGGLLLAIGGIVGGVIVGAVILVLMLWIWQEVIPFIFRAAVSLLMLGALALFIWRIFETLK